MKMIKSLAVTLGFILAVPAMAQDPVVGVADPESLFSDSDPALHKNKQAALHIMRELLQCNQWSDAGNWLTEKYTQHNPLAGNGLEAVIFYFVEVAKRERTENCGELTTEVVAVLASDDLVTVVMPRVLPVPGKPGETYSTTWFDMWRFVDGKADEHWDPAMLPTE